MIRNKNAFTLIELSIVLVIIGLIVGGVLAGKSLVAAATVRAQITQIERYNTAANTFFGKYVALPGDLTQLQVTQFGFATTPTRPGGRGQGDGNNVLEGYDYTAPAVAPTVQEGETAWFWEDLSANSNLIDQSFNTAGITQYRFGAYSTGSLIDQYMPQAKLGNGNYVGVYGYNGLNYFVISNVYRLGPGGACFSNPGMSVPQAYGIDSKMDDGLPQSGNVTAQYLLAAAPLVPSWVGTGTGATTGSSTTCYDNGGNAGTQQYSLAQNNGASANCALSIHMQAGD